MRKLGIREFRLNCTSAFRNEPVMVTHHGDASFFVIPAGDKFNSSVLEASSINSFYSATFGGGGGAGANLSTDKFFEEGKGGGA
jgi:hypothetical protein